MGQGRPARTPARARVREGSDRDVGAITRRHGVQSTTYCWLGNARQHGKKGTRKEANKETEDGGRNTTRHTTYSMQVSGRKGAAKTLVKEKQDELRRGEVKKGQNIHRKGRK